MATNDKAYGVGVSYRTPDGSLIWVFRSEWAEVLTDLGAMYGPDAVMRLTGQLGEAFGDGKQTIASVLNAPAPAPAARPAQQQVYTPPAPAAAPVAQEQEESQAGQSFEKCPACGAEKNRWVPPGVSSKTGKKYPGFFGCPTRGCSGR